MILALYKKYPNTPKVLTFTSLNQYVPQSVLVNMLGPLKHIYWSMHYVDFV